MRATARMSTFFSIQAAQARARGFLRQGVPELHAFVLGQAEGSFPAPIGVHRADALRVPVEEARMGAAIQLASQGLIGVDREVGRDDRQVGAGDDALRQEVPDPAVPVVDNGVCHGMPLHGGKGHEPPGALQARSGQVLSAPWRRLSPLWPEGDSKGAVRR